MTEIDPNSIDLSDIDLSDIGMWTRGSASRAEVFRTLRNTPGARFFAEPEIPGFGQGPGYWAFTRYEDVMHISRHPEVFVSGRGFVIADMPDELREFYGSMIGMDAPRHTRLRRIVNRSFTPRMVARLDEQVQVKARAIVSRIAGMGECDFVEQVAAPLPLQIICEMMGIPDTEWEHVYHLTNIILGAGDPEMTPDFATLLNASLEMKAMCDGIAEDRRVNPKDDLVTAMVHAEVDGERLTTDEITSFFILLASAGNETTRNAITHGLRALTDFPEQRARWQADPEAVSPTAVEELVRWATPVIMFRRTAVEDTMVGDQPVAEGDKVVMYYESANRDERVFTEPWQLNLQRDPVAEPHVGFGAGGPHFCLGANLARREIRVMFEELLHWLPDIEATTDPDYLHSGFIHGIKRMRCRFTPTEVPAS